MRLENHLGAYYDTHEIIMLYTKKPSKLLLNRHTREAIYSNEPSIGGSTYVPQQLYVVSDWTPKMKDFYYSGGNTDEYSIHQIVNDRLLQIVIEQNAKKIIASTDNIAESISDDFINEFINNNGYNQVIVKYRTSHLYNEEVLNEITMSEGEQYISNDVLQSYFEPMDVDGIIQMNVNSLRTQGQYLLRNK